MPPSSPVSLVSPETGLLPEAVLVPWEEGNLREEVGEQLCREATSVVLGPGLGQDEMARDLVRMVLSSACSPVVLDADGLNAVAACGDLTRYYTENIVITPHVLEMARLLSVPAGEVQRDLAGTALDYAGRFGITCVLKDAATVVAGRDGSLYVNSSGCSAMAKGGSGDVLGGILLSLLGQGMNPVRAAVCAVWLHGRAADYAAAQRSQFGMLPPDVLGGLTQLLAEEGY